MFAYIVFYLSLCAIVGLFGRAQPLGFLGYFILSLIFTPLVGALVLIILAFHTRAAIRKREKQAELKAQKAK